jgi:hypothetical protein
MPLLTGCTYTESLSVKRCQYWLLLVMSCHVVSFHVISCHCICNFIPFHVISCNFNSFQVTSYHIISSRIMPYRVKYIYVFLCLQATAMLSGQGKNAPDYRITHTLLSGMIIRIVHMFLPLGGRTKGQPAKQEAGFFLVMSILDLHSLCVFPRSFCSF